MGIDMHGLNFLNYARKYQIFGETVTIGRQGIHVIEPLIRKMFATNLDYKNQKYCEKLLIENYGSKTVDSIDNSDFEKASIIHDMNQPLPENLLNKYDTVIDSGCLEHIYNTSQALKNCSLLCKPGGQILHILPANNFCGHGFWQFSPELFFSLYSPENGYENTEVFLAELSNTKKWYQVKMPGNGNRVNIISPNETYVLTRTVLKNANFLHNSVQQSDYVYEWNRNILRDTETRSERIGIFKTIKNFVYMYRLLSPVYHSYKRFWFISKNKLNRRNPNLIEIHLRSNF
ncbi:MAG: class I SAM-dependent methyltransferase [Gammaproteobacteria bacterium]|nr:class I SAM-dependent methyltransferase [Gammaproteobacteria bacterium]